MFLLLNHFWVRASKSGVLKKKVHDVKIIYFRAGKEKCYLWTILMAFIAQFVRVKFARLKENFSFNEIVNTLKRGNDFYSLADKDQKSLTLSFV